MKWLTWSTIHLVDILRCKIHQRINKYFEFLIQNSQVIRCTEAKQIIFIEEKLTALLLRVECFSLIQRPSSCSRWTKTWNEFNWRWNSLSKHLISNIRNTKAVGNIIDVNLGADILFSVSIQSKMSKTTNAKTFSLLSYCVRSGSPANCSYKRWFDNDLLVSFFFWFDDNDWKVCCM